MSENIYIIKVKIAAAFDDPGVLGWAINCIGDQVAGGESTGPVWRGGSGPVDGDDIGTFEIWTSQEFHRRWQCSVDHQDLPALVEEIEKLAGKAYILAMEQQKQQENSSDEVIEFAKAWCQKANGRNWDSLSADTKEIYLNQAAYMIKTGYGKVK
jgi:hypothetical protein